MVHTGGFDARLAVESSRWLRWGNVIFPAGDVVEPPRPNHHRPHTNPSNSKRKEKNPRVWGEQ